MKTALELLGGKDYKKFRRLHMLTAEDDQALNMYSDMPDLAYCMRMNYITYFCDKTYNKCYNKKWNLLYEKMCKLTFTDIMAHATQNSLREKVVNSEVKRVKEKA